MAAGAAAEGRLFRIRTNQMTILRDIRHGQSSLEYALFASVVAAALVGMAVYVRRAIQANLKVMESVTNVQPMR